MPATVDSASCPERTELTQQNDRRRYKTPGRRGSISRRSIGTSELDNSNTNCRQLVRVERFNSKPFVIYMFSENMPRSVVMQKQWQQYDYPAPGANQTQDPNRNLIQHRNRNLNRNRNRKQRLISYLAALCCIGWARKKNV